MKNDIIDSVAIAMSAVGAAANLVMLCFFAWASAWLSEKSISAMNNAGGMSGLDLNQMQSMISGSDLPERASNYALAWFAAVGAAGCIFMTALGTRWAYHAAQRLLLALRD